MELQKISKVGKLKIGDQFTIYKNGGTWIKANAPLYARSEIKCKSIKGLKTKYLEPNRYIFLKEQS